MRRFSGATKRPGPRRRTPSSSTVPASGRSKPAMRRSVVVFPQPLGPSSASNSPGANVEIERRATAATAPNRLVSPRHATTAAAVACASFGFDTDRRHETQGILTVDGRDCTTRPRSTSRRSSRSRKRASSRCGPASSSGSGSRPPRSPRPSAGSSDHGYVELHGDRSLHLTDKGRSLATTVVRRHRLAERLLVDVIGLEWEKVHREADRWEHAISADVEEKLVELLGDPATCPHGNPIPGSKQRGAGDADRSRSRDARAGPGHRRARQRAARDRPTTALALVATAHLHARVRRDDRRHATPTASP